MTELACITKGLNFHLEQVQDFTPTPMTVASEIYYTGIHPYTGEKVYTATTEKEKLAQRQFFFWYKPEMKTHIVEELQRLHRPDLVRALYPGYKPIEKKSTNNTRNFNNSNKPNNKKTRK